MPKPLKSNENEDSLSAPTVPLRQHASPSPGIQARMSAIVSGSKPFALHEPPHPVHLELINEQVSHKSTSSGLSSMPVSGKDENTNSAENGPATAPPVVQRGTKPALGTRVLPAFDPNGEAPISRLRPPQTKRKTRHPLTCEIIAA
jgi:hypothetical protein